jgi:3-hydroxy-9,10-secoandrosta-1,3,5(10)-triene-9,17-dione monooxygenase reductase component
MDQSIKFRQCLGKFATGVTVVTCRDAAGQPCGITANSFSSVSLDPPLVLWNIAKVSRSLRAYLDAEHFAINVLSEKQQTISSRFARSEENLFDGIDFQDSQFNVPLLADTISCFECRNHAVHDCGDHHIIIGEVVGFRSADIEPLVFYAGHYSKLQS